MATTYRGPDRRQAVPESRRRVGGRQLALVLVVALVCAALPWTGGALGDVELSLTTDALHAVAPALLFGASMLWLARWRLTEEAQVASTAVAFCLVALLVFPLDLGAGLIFDDARWQQNNPVSWTVITPMVFIVMWRGLHHHSVDSRVRPVLLLWLLAGASALVFVCAVVAHHAGVLVLDPPAARVQVAELVAAVLWGVLAVRHVLDGRRGGSAAQLWIAAALVLLALGCTYRALAVTREIEWSFAAVVSVTAAAAVALWSAMADLLEVYAHAGDRHVSVSSAAADAERDLTDEHARQEEMVHEARSAIASVRATTYNLGRWGEELSVDLRADLAAALTTELARLEALIDRPEAPLEDFDLRDVLDPVLEVHRLAGSRIRSAVAPVCVRGSRRDLATVLENLLGNARRYAPGSIIDVWSTVSGVDVHVHVGDRGPGVPRGERATVFDRGVRGRGSAGVEGSGLGLYISQRLMAAQDGVLRAVERPGGGVVFEVVLPRADAAPDLVVARGDGDAAWGRLRSRAPR